jgi:hypothetical protein
MTAATGRPTILAMGRGQNVAPASLNYHGITKQELCDAGDISAKTFDLMRKAARVRGPSHGGLTFVFTFEDVAALIKRAESGSFTERGGFAAKAWRALLLEQGIELEPAVAKRPAKQRNRQN